MSAFNIRWRHTHSWMLLRWGFGCAPRPRTPAGGLSSGWTCVVRLPDGIADQNHKVPVKWNCIRTTATRPACWHIKKRKGAAVQRRREGQRGMPPSALRLRPFAALRFSLLRKAEAKQHNKCCGMWLSWNVTRHQREQSILEGVPWLPDYLHAPFDVGGMEWAVCHRFVVGMWMPFFGERSRPAPRPEAMARRLPTHGVPPKAASPAIQEPPPAREARHRRPHPSSLILHPPPQEQKAAQESHKSQSKRRIVCEIKPRRWPLMHKASPDYVPDYESWAAIRCHIWYLVEYARRYTHIESLSSYPSLAAETCWASFGGALAGSA